MFTSRTLCAFCFLILCLFSPALAQVDQPANVEQPARQIPSTVTASATAERVRFTAPGTVVQMHLQVYDNGGQLVFDVNSKGNVLDWTLQDSGGARLNPGSYLSVVTVKSLSGRLSQRIGSVSVQEKQVELQRVDAMQMTAAQQQAVGPVEENIALTILQAGETEATTVLAHDGTQGQINRSIGALSFRLGDFFSGKDEEQMRLTEAGNLGIGTDNPQAKLDVAGVIRTSKGIEFDNGTNVTKLTTTATGSLQQTLADGTVVPNATGSGTQNKLAKWIDNAGTLSDSVVTEASGKIGIGTSSPQAALHVIGNQFLKPVGATPTYEVLAGSDPNTTVMLTTDSAAFGWQIAPSTAPSDTIVQVLGQSFAAVPNRGEFGIYLGADSNSAFKVIQRGGPELMRVNRAGNLGVGTTNPQSPLDVAGNINTSTQYNIGGNRVFTASDSPYGNTLVGVTAGTSISTAIGNSFLGLSAGRLNTEGNYNSFFGMSAGQGNTIGRSNSFFGAFAGENNTEGYNNSYFGDSAGRNDTTGVQNSFFGQEAGLHNTMGSSNVFLGFFAGLSNTLESNNTFVGANSNGATGITNATAIGFQAQVTRSNSLVLGSSGVNVGIGTASPLYKLHVKTGTDQNLLVRPGADFGDTGIALQSVNDIDTVYKNLHLEGEQIAMNVGSAGNVGIGTNSPAAKLHVVNGDAAITTQGNGIILKATNGSLCYRVTVNNAGTLSTSSVTCP